MGKMVLFQTIQFFISTQFSSIWPIDMTLEDATIPVPEWTLVREQKRGTLHSLKLQH